MVDQGHSAEKEVPAVVRIVPSSNVLVVEDDFDSAKTLVHSLIEEGFGVRSASSREEALAVIERYIYDVIVMHYSIPGMCAEDFVLAVRRRFPQSKFILITASDQVKKRATSLGIQLWIGKPFNPEVLLQMIKNVSVMK